MTQFPDLIFIFFCYLNGINPSSWMTFLIIVFDFFENLGLRLISSRKIVGLNLIFVFIRSLIVMLLIAIVLVFFNQPLVSFQVSRIDLLNPGGWLQVGFYFYIDNLFYYFVSRIQVPSSII